MTKEQLFKSLNSIDDSILEQSEKPAATRKTGHTIFKFCAVAACLGAIITSAFAINRIINDMPTLPTKTPDNLFTTTTTGPSESISLQTTDRCLDYIDWNTYYTEVSSISAMLLDIPGYFTEELNELELNEVLPDIPVNIEDYSGYAGFDYTGKLIDVHLSVNTGLPESDMNVFISTSEYNDCYYVFEESPVVSFCGSTPFYMYIYETDKDVTLLADTNRDGVYYHFIMRAPSDSIDSAKREFAIILNHFSNYGKNVKVPDLSTIIPDVIPEYKNEILTLSEAIKDSDFGSYMLADTPAGYNTESIRRYIDQNSNFLSGLWTHGYNSLSWQVYYLSGNDSARITDVADTANYDLSLYPIPRAESVPKELREIVDNPIFRFEELTLDVIYKRAYTINDSGDLEGYRMHFSVLYGDIIVDISTKGISPEWLFEQLSGLIE